MTDKKSYTAPELTVVSFHVERGYASTVSPQGGLDMMLQFGDGNSSSQMESFNDNHTDNWGYSNSDNFFN